MRNHKTFTIIFLSGLVLFLAVTIHIPILAQSNQAKNPGSYHGENDFPISWKRYYGYAEWTKILQDPQAKYPQLADIQSIGKSRMGRDQFLLTIAAKATGKADGKPAMWVDGAIHGNPQPALDFGGARNKDGQGFAAFGKVVGGMDVVRKIHEAPQNGQSLKPPVKILSVTRIGG